MTYLNRALAISGYMSEPELLQLATWASRYQSIVEIGSFFGRSTRAMADNSPAASHLLAIDDFGGLREHGTNNPSSSTIREGFLWTMADHLQSGKVTILQVSHATVTPTANCEMCFIDGSHDYASVSRDISKWLPHTTRLLCGHDLDAGHPGVQQAVDELVPHYRIIPGTSLWWSNQL